MEEILMNMLSNVGQIKGKIITREAYATEYTEI